MKRSTAVPLPFVLALPLAALAADPGTPSGAGEVARRFSRDVAVLASDEMEDAGWGPRDSAAPPTGSRRASVPSASGRRFRADTGRTST